MKPDFPLADSSSARLILNEQMISWVDKLPDHAAERSRILDIQLNIASEMLGLAQTLLRTGLCGSEESTPFCLDAMYRSALIYGRIYQSTATSDIQEVVEDFQKGLNANNKRWKAAGKISEWAEHSRVDC
jgi:hypothetical protein